MHTNAEVVAGPRRVLLTVGTPLTTTFVAIHGAPRRSVVARRNDVALACEDGADMAALAVGPGPHTNGDRHHVLVNVRSFSST